MTNVNELYLSFQMVPIFLLELLTQITEIFLGYDYGGSDFNSMTISFLNVGECFTPDDKFNTIVVYL